MHRRAVTHLPSVHPKVVQQAKPSQAKPVRLALRPPDGRGTLPLGVRRKAKLKTVEIVIFGSLEAIFERTELRMWRT
jgi:hypothetical protein